jgi:hypothetical protein
MDIEDLIGVNMDIEDLEVGDIVLIKTKGICKFNDASCEYCRGDSDPLPCSKEIITVSKLLRTTQCNSYSEDLF